MCVLEWIAEPWTAQWSRCPQSQPPESRWTEWWQDRSNRPWRYLISHFFPILYLLCLLYRAQCPLLAHYQLTYKVKKHRDWISSLRMKTEPRVCLVAVCPPISTFLCTYTVFTDYCLSRWDRNIQQESLLFVGNLIGGKLSYSLWRHHSDCHVHSLSQTKLATLQAWW